MPPVMQRCCCEARCGVINESRRPRPRSGSIFAERARPLAEIQRPRIMAVRGPGLRAAGKLGLKDKLPFALQNCPACEF